MPIRILALIIFFQIQIACQQQQDVTQHHATKASFKTIDTGQVISGETNPSAENVIFQSVDGGKTWLDAGAGLPKDIESGMLFTSGGELFFNTAYGLFQKNGYASNPVWQKEVFPDKRIEEIFPGRASLYGYTAGVGFFTELQGSGIWIHVGNTLEGRSVRTLVEAPDGSVLVGSDTGIYRSTDGCKSWKQVFKGDMVTSIHLADKFLFAGGLQGLLRSANDGEHWDLIETNNGRAYHIGIIESGVTAIFEGVSPYKDAIQNRIKNDLLVSADGGKRGLHLMPVCHQISLSLELYSQAITSFAALNPVFTVRVTRAAHGNSYMLPKAKSDLMSLLRVSPCMLSGGLTAVKTIVFCYQAFSVILDRWCQSPRML